MFDKNAFLSALQQDLGLTEVELTAPLTSDMTPYQAAASHLYREVLSKYQESGEMSIDAQSRGEEKFLAMNARSLAYSEPARDELLEVVIGEFRKELYDLYMPAGHHLFDFSRIKGELMVGPGASIGSQSYNFYSKLFDSDLTASHPYLFVLYRSAIADDPAWSTAEAYRLRRYGYRVVGSSRLFHVPKETLITRTATTLPLVNMLFQKATATVLEHRMASYLGLNIRSQPERNKRMARRGSRWGSFGTIDGKSASDCINLRQLDHLPPVVAGWIKTIRVGETVMPNGQVVSLGMCGTMGEGFTFAFQTAYFACLVRAVYRVLGIKPTRANMGVFGDDIIVRRDAYDLVMKTLRHVGQLPNDDKSFNSGSFRESCGGDYWRGYDIRPPYIKSLSTDADVYVAINRLTHWAQKWVPLVNACVYLKQLVAQPLFVPPWMGEAEGIHISASKANAMGLLRRNKRGELVVKFLKHVPYKVRLRDRDPNSDDMQMLVYGKGKLIVKKPSSGGRFKRPVGYNPWGLMTSFLGGFIENSCITLRTGAEQFKVARVNTLFWDHPVGADRFGRDHEWQLVVEETF